MSCIYSNFQGVCNLFDENIENPACDENGYCLVDYDENPDCENFEEC